MLAAIETAMGGPMTAPVKPDAAAWYHPGRSGTLALGSKILAYFGELHPKVIAAFDLRGSAASFEIFLDAIPEPKNKGKARPASSSEAVGRQKSPFAPSPFQPVERDFAFVVDRAVKVADIVRAAFGVDRKLITAVNVFDLYEGERIESGKKSVAIAVTIQPREKTMTDQEIEALAGKIVAEVGKRTGGVLRA